MGLRRRSPDAVLAAAIAGATATGELTPAPAKHRRVHRSWPQRFVLIFNSVISVALLAAAGLIWYANNRLGDRALIQINSSPVTPTAPVASQPDVAVSTIAGQVATPPVAATIPDVIDFGAKNFLLTASDSRECIDPNSPYAGAFGNASDVAGARADTIMLLRVNSNTEDAAILSFPRDLWVKIDGRTGKGRINGALDQNNPAKIINTIGSNFYVGIDHWINIDFCAFRDLVDAVNGVSVPFQFPTRDRNTGLYIETPECHTFGGEEGLAYVRSRHYQWLDERGKWQTDGTSDIGRITRQQDFLKRAMAKALSRWKVDPGLAKGLVDTAIDNVRTDSELTAGLMLDVANAMRSFDAAKVRTFQIEASGRKINNQSVLVPNLNSDYMENVLKVFRGQLRIVDAADLFLPPVETTVPVSPTTTRGTPGSPTTASAAGSAAGPKATTTTVPATTTTVPVVVIDEQTNKGIAPPDDPSCT